MKVTVTIKHTQTATFDPGDIPANLLRDVLTKNDGTFDGNWGVGDVDKNETWTVDSIEVAEEGK